MTEHPFRLSKVNKIFFALIFITYIVIAVIMIQRIRSNTNADFHPILVKTTSKFIAETIVVLPIFFIGSYSLAWCVWRYRGKKKNGGTDAFTIVLVLLFLSIVEQQITKYNQQMHLYQLNQEDKQFKNEIVTIEDPILFNKTFREATDSKIEHYKILSNSNDPVVRALYKFLVTITKEDQNITLDWNLAFSQVQSPRILDFSVLNKDQEFDYQRNVLKTYINRTENYKNYVINKLPRLEKVLQGLDSTDPKVIETRKSVYESFNSKGKNTIPLLDEYIDYGNNILKIIELLQKNQGEWRLENNEMKFENADIEDEIYTLLDSLEFNEITINELAAKLLENL